MKYIYYNLVLVICLVINFGHADELFNDFGESETKRGIEEHIASKIWHNLQNQYPELKAASIESELRLIVEGKKKPLLEYECKKAFACYQLEKEERIARENLIRSEQLLNRLKEDIEFVEVQKGLLYYKPIVLCPEGAQIKKDDIINVKLTELGEDGNPLSDGQLGCLTLCLNETIQGFMEGMVGMRLGERRIIYIHPKLGYGKLGHLEPNILLIYDVEAISQSANLTGKS